MDNRRLDYLDSIRGIAALLVLLHHCWHASIGHEFGLSVAASSLPNLVQYAITKLLAGHAAVMVFFVLSGFVLAYSLRKQPAAYGPFLIKRIFRIYPAFAFAGLCSYALHCLIGVEHRTSNVFLTKEVLTPDLSPTVLLKHLALWGTVQAKGLNCVSWSLVHEIRISLMFPFILLLVDRYRWRAVAACGFFSFGCTLLSFYVTGHISTGINETTFFGSFLATGFFIVFFAAGALLSIEREAVAVIIRRLSKRRTLLLFVIVGACLLKSTKDSVADIASDYITGAGAIGLIALSLAGDRFQSVLKHKMPLWLGRVSYSLYLVHVPVLYVITQTVGAGWPPVAYSLAVIVISLLVAELTARLIEFPFMRIGKRVAGLAAPAENAVRAAA